MIRVKMYGVACTVLLSGFVAASCGATFYFYGKANSGSQFWRQATLDSPQDSKAFTFLGYSLETEGKPAEATKSFEKAVALQRSNYSALMELGSLAVARGDQAKARGYWREVAVATQHSKTNRGQMWHRKATDKLQILAEQSVANSNE